MPLSVQNTRAVYNYRSGQTTVINIPGPIGGTPPYTTTLAQQTTYSWVSISGLTITVTAPSNTVAVVRMTISTTDGSAATDTKSFELHPQLVQGFFSPGDIIQKSNLEEMGLQNVREDDLGGEAGQWQITSNGSQIQYDDGVQRQVHELAVQTLQAGGAASGDHTHRMAEFRSNDDIVVDQFTIVDQTTKTSELLVNFTTAFSKTESLLIVGSCLIEREIASGELSIGWSTGLVGGVIYPPDEPLARASWRQAGQDNLLRFETAMMIINSPPDSGTVGIKLVVSDRTINGVPQTGELPGTNRLAIRAIRIGAK